VGVDRQCSGSSVEEEEQSKERQGNDKQRGWPSVHNNQTEYGGGRRKTETVAEEWESLKALMEADEAERNMVADDIIGTLGMENKTIKGTIDERAV
jgi:hypothetical protein